MKTNSLVYFINNTLANIDNFVYNILVAVGMPKNSLIFKFGGNSVPEIDLEIDSKSKN